VDGQLEGQTFSRCNKGFIASGTNTVHDRSISPKSRKLLSQSDQIKTPSLDEENKLISPKGSSTDRPPRQLSSYILGESNRVPMDMSYHSKHGFEPKKDSSEYNTSQGASGGTENFSMSVQGFDLESIDGARPLNHASFIINESLLRDTNLFGLSKISILGDSGMSKD
jgi:hypothetical protein